MNRAAADIDRASDAAPAASSPAHYHRDLIAAAAIYLMTAAALWGRGLAGCANCYIGRESDPPLLMWFMRWWPYALAHRLNPLHTDLIWAPPGFNLAWAAIIPLPSLLSIPLQPGLGLIGSYNLLVILAIASAATAAYALCRRAAGAFWPALAGGALFGFSPYMLGQSLGHLHTLEVFPIPLLALAALKRLDGELSGRGYVALFAALLAALALCSIELFATFTIVAGLAMIVALACAEADLRLRLARLIAPTALAYLGVALLLAPYFYALLAPGHPHAPVWDPDRYTADAVNFVVPTELNWMGRLATPRAIAHRFRGTLMENGAYLGVVLIAIVELFRRRTWRTPAGRFLVLLMAAVVLIAIGPTLHVAGRKTFPMPGALLAHLPLISSALPVRFMLYAFLAAGVIAALWLASPSVSAPVRWAFAAALALSMLPNPRAAFWTRPLDIPAFFASGDYRRMLAPGEIVLALPFGQQGNSMYWQAQSAMYFRMAGGWTGVTPFEFERMPAVNFFDGADDLPEAGEQLKAYLARFAVGAIVADPGGGRIARLQPALDSLGLAREATGGLWIYRIPGDRFAAYRSLDPACLERRATTLRLDAVLAAAAAYLKSGRDPARLSPAALAEAGLLPRDWTVNSAADAFNDWGIAPLRDGQIAIAMRASYDAAAPLIERYYPDCSAILYPAPARWTPGSNPDRHTIMLLALIFSRGQIVAAAEQLKAAPPATLAAPLLSACRRQPPAAADERAARMIASAQRASARLVSMIGPPPAATARSNSAASAPNHAE